MNGWMVGWLLPLALVWPLLVAGAVASRPMRALGLMLAPWAALPALVVALAAPDTVQRLPGVMLGSVLLLDDTGRPFLLATALLWLAAGLLARGAAAEPRFVLLLLLAMTGGIGLALAGDLSLLLAASTLAGYALYGLLAERGCGRVLVLLLVASDLLVFELLLLLASGAGGLELAALRAQWAVAEDQWLLLPLLLMGFGARGLLGVHFWLAPAFAGAPLASRPALVAFMLAAGLLGWLRLLPLGEVQWPAAGGLLQWLGLAAIGYAAIAGLLQARLPAVLAYAAVTLTGLWTCVLGAVLAQPGLAASLGAALPMAAVQSALAMAALLVLATPLPTGRGQELRTATAGIAALLLAAAPLGVAGVLADSGGGPGSGWPLAGIGLLTGRGLYLALRRDLIAVGRGAVGVAAGLTLAALIVAALIVDAGRASDIPIPIPGLLCLLAGWVAGLAFEPVARRLPRLSPGRLPALLGPMPTRALAGVRWFAEERLPSWRDGIQTAVKAARAAAGWRQAAQGIETALRPWATAIALFVLVGLLAAGLARLG